MKSTNASTPMVVGALAIASIVGAAAFVLTQSRSNNLSASQASTIAQTAAKETPTQATNTAVAANTATPSTVNTTTTGYKDGTYSASADYQVPHGSNTIDVTLTLENGVVSAVKTSHDYGDRESGMYTDSFDNTIKSAIISKSLDISLSRVGGASLTTYAFEDALATIANQAKA